MGTTVTNKNGIEFDIDALATDVNGKADKDLVNVSTNVSVCIESWHDENGNWCRVYSDGWCEQGGRGTFAHNKRVTVNLAKEYVNANFNVILSSVQAGFGAAACLSASPKTTSQIEVFNYNTSSASMRIYWRTEGYIR